MDIFAELVPKDARDIPLTPYEKITPVYSLVPKNGRAIIKSTLKIAARIKVLFMTDNGTKSLKVLKKRFADSFY